MNGKGTLVPRTSRALFLTGIVSEMQTWLFVLSEEVHNLDMSRRVAETNQEK